MIGFRVALGKPIDTLGAPSAAVDGTLNYQQGVSQESPTFIHDYDAEDAAPYFDGPKSDADHYVKISGANDITGPFSLGDVQVDLMESNHPGGSAIYGLNRGGHRIVYATDFEHTEEKLKELADYHMDVMENDMQISEDVHMIFDHMMFFVLNQG